MIDLLAGRYAQTFYDYCQEKDALDSGYQDFKNLGALIHQSKELRDFLKDPTLTSEKKEHILEQIFKKHLAAITFQFILFLEHKNRLNLLGNICVAFDHLYKKSKNILKVKIKSSTSLDKQQVDAICRQLNQKYHKDIEPEVIVDAKLMGGFAVQVGDSVYDFSLQTQLEQFKNSLIQTR